MANYKSNLDGWNDLSAHHINSHLEDYEHARSGFFQFVVNFSKDDKILKPSVSEENGSPSEGDYIDYNFEGDVIRLSVDSVTVPHFQVGTIPVERGNSVVNFAGKPTWDSGNFTCRDFVGLHTKEVLMAWQRLTYDPISDKGGRGKDYKKECTLIEYTQDFKEIRRWTLVGVFPTGISESEFDKSKGEEARNITVNFIYDRAFLLPTENDEEIR